jgi:hypothetical protein
MLKYHVVVEIGVRPVGNAIVGDFPGVKRGLSLVTWRQEFLISFDPPRAAEARVFCFVLSSTVFLIQLTHVQ